MATIFFSLQCRSQWSSLVCDLTLLNLTFHMQFKLCYKVLRKREFCLLGKCTDKKLNVRSHNKIVTLRLHGKSESIIAWSKKFLTLCNTQKKYIIMNKKN